jgi:hypothetical protein
VAVCGGHGLNGPLIFRMVTGFVHGVFRNLTIPDQVWSTWFSELCCADQSYSIVCLPGAKNKGETKNQ